MVVMVPIIVPIPPFPTNQRQVKAAGAWILRQALKGDT